MAYSQSFHSNLPTQATLSPTVPDATPATVASHNTSSSNASSSAFASSSTSSKNSTSSITSFNKPSQPANPTSASGTPSPTTASQPADQTSASGTPSPTTASQPADQTSASGTPSPTTASQPANPSSISEGSNQMAKPEAGSNNHILLALLTVSILVIAIFAIVTTWRYLKRKKKKNTVIQTSTGGNKIFEDELSFRHYVDSNAMGQSPLHCTISNPPQVKGGTMESLVSNIENSKPTEFSPQQLSTFTINFTLRPDMSNVEKMDVPTPSYPFQHTEPYDPVESASGRKDCSIPISRLWKSKTLPYRSVSLHKLSD